MIRRLLIALALAGVSAPAFAADLATPTATAAATTPAATPAPKDALIIVTARGNCKFNLPIIGTPVPVATPDTGFGHNPTNVKVTCGASGAEVGNLVLARLENFDGSTGLSYEALRLDGCDVHRAGQIDCTLKFDGNIAGFDPAPLTIKFMAVSDK